MVVICFGPLGQKHFVKMWVLSAQLKNVDRKTFRLIEGPSLQSCKVTHLVLGFMA